MAVYTTFERAALERYLIMFDLGELDEFEPIEGGIENSNYFVRFKDGDRDFVLTITEELDFSDVAFFNDLLQVYCNAGLPVPEPQRTLDGMASTTFKKKPTWLFNRLPGVHLTEPDIDQCQQIGSILAKLHECSEKARYHRHNYYDKNWASAALEKVSDQLNEENRRLLERSVEAYLKHESEFAHLPKGIIHGDLFRDNALFEGDQLSGVIDFYHASEDFLIQDVAIALNDWCPGDLAAQDALLSGYNSVRPLTADEQSALMQFRQFGAMRFALTRLLGGRSDNPVKNPKEFLHLLASMS